MPRKPVSVVLVHGAWADGTSWAKIIRPLAEEGYGAVAAPLPGHIAKTFAALGWTADPVGGSPQRTGAPIDQTTPNGSLSWP